MSLDHHQQHHEMHHHRDVGAARCFVLTVSDTRTLDSDEGGTLVAKLLGERGHEVVGRRLVPDDEKAIRTAVLDVVESGAADVLISTGGTGIAPRDVTPEALEPLFRCRLDGFGEAFRRLSFDAMGPPSILSRALAGVIHHTLVFALPGSPAGCRLAIDELVGPVLRHAVGLVRPSLAEARHPDSQQAQPEAIAPNGREAQV